MPQILALDSSTEACSVALFDGSELVEDFQILPREHTKRMLPMVEQLLSGRTALAELDGIAFGAGPGSFTGLRICLGLVQGLAYGANLPVISVSSLAALALTLLESSPQSRTAMPLIDARMDEVYWAEYERNEEYLICPVQGDCLSAPEQVAAKFAPENLVVGGSGLVYRERMANLASGNLLDQDLLPSAAAIARLGFQKLLHGELQSAAEAKPLYLRDQVAWQKS